MFRMKSPTSLWDDCLELEADSMSHTAHEGFMLQGEVPQVMVSGQTCDISRWLNLGGGSTNGYGGLTSTTDSQY
jgi:hypothetical protein